MDKMSVKTQKEISIMMEGGKRLAEVKNHLKAKIKVGVSAEEIENIATSLIKKTGGKPSFKMVPGYFWSTCINVNDGVVHGIPKNETVFRQEDLISVDLGLFFKGFHTDTSFSVLLGKDKEKEQFLQAGKRALKNAIKKTQKGFKIEDIAEAIESTLVGDKLTPIKSFTGHGIGKNLHEKPAVPCYVSGSKSESVALAIGMALAIEVMYSTGSGEVVLADDSWTISTRDGKIAALFEETVAVTSRGPIVLTTQSVAS